MLALSVVCLAGQLAWPSARSFLLRPLPGRVGIIGNPVAARTPSLAAECLVYLPDGYAAGGQPYPLLLYLHGAAASGDDIDLPFKYGLPALLRAGRQIPVVVVGPQCREGGQWNASDLKMLVDAVVSDYRLDGARVFVAGYSMGGFGAWDFATSYPQLVAAMASVAGAAPPGDGKTLANIPIWAFHGDRDDVVDIDVTRLSVEQVEKAGGHPKLTIYEGAGHGIENRALGGDEVFDWMLSANDSNVSASK